MGCQLQVLRPTAAYKIRIDDVAHISDIKGHSAVEPCNERQGELCLVQAAESHGSDAREARTLHKWQDAHCRLSEPVPEIQSVSLDRLIFAGMKTAWQCRC